MPLPGLDVAVTCNPNRDKKWGFNAGAEASGRAPQACPNQVERLLDDEVGEEIEFDEGGFPQP